MRPRPIVLFERLFFGSLLLGAASAALDPVPLAEISQGQEGLVLLIGALLVAAVVAMILLVSRRGSRIAKWVITVFTLTGTVGIVPQIAEDLERAPHLGAIALVQAGMQLAAIWQIFRAEAEPWFAPA